MLPKEQVEQIKKQLIQQIESTFPDDKKEQAIQQIESMDEEQLEQFLAQNNLIKDEKQSSQSNCIFCSIVSGQAQSFQIDENKDSIAILELNPISKGHVLIIPKEHISESGKIPKSVFSLTKKISKKLRTKFKPKDVEIASSNLFGHEIVNVFPVYENENLNSPRQKATPKELEKLKKQLEKKIKPKIIRKEKPKEIASNKLWLPKRIP